MRQDHPRSRGVYHLRRIIPDAGVGSSPLARGLRGAGACGGGAGGIIPARAGFTRRPGHPVRPGEDHPRSRGVYEPPRRPVLLGLGSSPLARGLLCGGRLRPARRGIIPARAGFTRARTRPHGGNWDHPRSRGVYPTPPTPARTPTGSSPLARGLLGHALGVEPADGIIPARAGFTRRGRSAGRRGPDHPRSRGVYTA